MILDRKGEIENMMLICAEDGEKRSASLFASLLLVACLLASLWYHEASHHGDDGRWRF